MTTFFTVKDKTELVLTGNALVDMAKQVSDKMILSKAEVWIFYLKRNFPTYKNTILIFKFFLDYDPTKRV